MSPVTEVNSPFNLVRNTLMVILAVVVVQFFVHVLSSSIDAFGSYLIRNGLYLVIYAVVFAYMYDKVSALWRPGRPNAFLRSTIKPDPVSKLTANKLLNSAFFSVTIFIIASLVKYFGETGGFGDTDGEGIADTFDGVEVIILIASGLAAESGGKTESDTDENDKGVKAGSGTGG